MVYNFSFSLITKNVRVNRFAVHSCVFRLRPGCRTGGSYVSLQGTEPSSAELLPGFPICSVVSFIDLRLLSNHRLLKYNVVENVVKSVHSLLHHLEGGSRVYNRSSTHLKGEPLFKFGFPMHELKGNRSAPPHRGG